MDSTYRSPNWTPSTATAIRMPISLTAKMPTAAPSAIAVCRPSEASANPTAATSSVIPSARRPSSPIDCHTPAVIFAVLPRWLAISQNAAVQSAPSTTVRPNTVVSRAASFVPSTVSRFGRQSSRFIIPPVFHSAPTKEAPTMKPNSATEAANTAMNRGTRPGSRTGTAGTTSPRTCRAAAGSPCRSSGRTVPRSSPRAWAASHSAMVRFQSVIADW
ncbi:hypothetical protein V2I01_10615 [Micromonospora sp. BRA006-A]|nr:hypothetical protein [Micromonospora sp. BRA006-A]